MGIGSGLASTFGIATETTVGTPVAVTRFVGHNSETMSMKKHTVQGAGLRGGLLYKLGSLRGLTAREVAGGVNFDLPAAGMGVFFQHMFGSFSTTPTSLGGGLFQQIHNTGSLQGKAFTTQIVKPDYTGVLAQNAYTYSGCKVTGWKISGQTQAQLKVDLTIDAIDGLTPSSAFAGTTLSASVSAAATSISTVATIAAGSYVLIGTGLTAEVVLTGTPTGSGPFAIPIVGAPIAYAHSSGATVTDPTSVNYGAAAALQAASYLGAANFYYDPTGSSLIAGGSTSVVSGIWTNTGGQVVANVRSFSLNGTNQLKVDRFGIGSALKSEQIENDYRSLTLDADVEYGSPYFYQNYAADVPLCMVLKFTNPLTPGSYVQFFLPVGFQNDGTEAQVSGPDIIIPKLQVEALSDGTNGAFQCVLVNTDAAV